MKLSISTFLEVTKLTITPIDRKCEIKGRVSTELGSTTFRDVADSFDVDISDMYDELESRIIKELKKKGLKFHENN